MRYPWSLYLEFHILLDPVPKETGEGGHHPRDLGPIHSQRLLEPPNLGGKRSLHAEVQHLSDGVVCLESEPPKVGAGPQLELRYSTCIGAAFTRCEWYVARTGGVLL